MKLKELLLVVDKDIVVLEDYASGKIIEEGIRETSSRYLKQFLGCRVKDVKPDDTWLFVSIITKKGGAK